MGQWAFACCRSTIKTSYCVGRLGVENEQAASRNGGVGLLTGPDGGMNSLKALDKDDGDGQAGKGKRKADDSRDAEGQRLLKKRAGEGDPKLDKGKLAEALKNEEERLRKADIEADDRSRKFNGLSTAREVTDEDMGTYRCSPPTALSLAPLPDPVSRSFPCRGLPDETQGCLQRSYGELPGHGLRE